MGKEIQMSGERRSSENRQPPRFRYRGETTVRRLDTNPSLPGHVLDLSARGCLLRLPDLAEFEVGALVDMSITSNLISFRALGSVRHRSRRRRLLGISFVNLTQRGQADLLALIDSLEKDEQAGRSVVQEITILPHLAQRPSSR
jgi:hypothetical protein